MYCHSEMMLLSYLHPKVFWPDLQKKLRNVDKNCQSEDFAVTTFVLFIIGLSYLVRTFLRTCIL